MINSIFPSKIKAYNKTFFSLVPIFLSKKPTSFSEALSFFEKQVGTQSYIYLYLTLSLLKSNGFISEIKEDKITYPHKKVIDMPYKTMTKETYNEEGSLYKNIEYINEKYVKALSSFNNLNKEELIENFKELLHDITSSIVKISTVKEVLFPKMETELNAIVYYTFNIEDFNDFYQKNFDITFNDLYLDYLSKAKIWWDNRYEEHYFKDNII